MSTQPETKDSTPYTPGPWREERPAPGNNPIVVNTEGRDVAFVVDGYLHGDLTGAFPVATIEANARLIAAAPDLLAALEAMRSRFGPRASAPWCCHGNWPHKPCDCGQPHHPGCITEQIDALIDRVSNGPVGKGDTA